MNPSRRGSCNKPSRKNSAATFKESVVATAKSVYDSAEGIVSILESLLNSLIKLAKALTSVVFQPLVTFLKFLRVALFSTGAGSVGWFMIWIVVITVFLSLAATLTRSDLCVYPVSCYKSWLYGEERLDAMCATCVPTTGTCTRALWSTRQAPCSGK